MRILSTGIASLMATCIIGNPRPAFGDEDGKIDKPTVQLGLDDKVAGEEPADFSFLEGAEKEEPGAPAPRQGASESEKVTEEPKPGSEPPAPKPATPKITDPNDELEVPAVKPTDEVPVPDPKEEAAKSEEAKKAETAKTEEDKAAAAKLEAEKAAAAKPEEVKLPTEEEVDAMQPKPGAPAKVIADFKKLKDEALKPALREVTRLKEELKKVTEQPALTDEIKARLAQADEDRAWREGFELEKDPAVQKEFAEKTEKAETALFTLLRDHPKLRMTQKAIDDLKAIGLDSEDGLASRTKIIAAVKDLGDDFILDDVKAAFRAVEQVSKERSAKVETLRGSQENLVAAKAEKEKAERIAWAGQCDANLIETVKEDPRFLLRQPAEGASEAEKKEIEAHNKNIQENIVPKMHEGIRALYARDPKETMRFLVASLRLPEVEKELDTTKKELDQTKARVKELEQDGSKIRRVSAVSQVSNAPVGAAKQESAPPVDESADDAIDRYRREQGIHPGNQGTVKVS